MPSALSIATAAAAVLFLAPGAFAQPSQPDGRPVFAPDGSVMASPGPMPSPGTNTPANTLPYSLQTTPNGARAPGRVIAMAPIPDEPKRAERPARSRHTRPPRPPKIHAGDSTATPPAPPR
jgi:hypothetical protein